MNTADFIYQRIQNSEPSSFVKIAYRLALISIAVAIASLIISVFVLLGFKNQIKEKIFGFESHIQVSQFSLNSNVFDHYPLSTNTDLFKNGAKEPDIKDIEAIGYLKGIMHAGEQVYGLALKGVEPGYKENGFKEYMTEGKFIQEDSTGFSKGVVLSNYIANKMNIKVGDEVSFYFFENNKLRPRKLYVEGFYQTYLEEFDRKIILCDLGLIRQLKGWGDTLSGGYEVFLNDYHTLDQSEQKVFDQMEMHMQTQKITDKYAYLFDWLVLLDQNVVLFIVILMIIAFFNITSVMYIISLERTNMIGVLKSLGAKKSLLKLVFLRVGLGILVRGLFWGNLIGIGVCLLQSYLHIIPLDPVNYYLEYVPVSWDWAFWFFLNIGAIVFVLFSIYVPVSIAASFKPIKSIRFN